MHEQFCSATESARLLVNTYALARAYSLGSTYIVIIMGLTQTYPNYSGVNLQKMIMKTIEYSVKLLKLEFIKIWDTQGHNNHHDIMYNIIVTVISSLQCIQKPVQSGSSIGVGRRRLRFGGGGHTAVVFFFLVRIIIVEFENAHVS